jgi:hypothetical protein
MEISCSLLLAATRWETRRRWPSIDRIEVVSRSAICADREGLNRPHYTL